MVKEWCDSSLSFLVFWITHAEFVLCRNKAMFRKLKALYEAYKEYVRVDLIMYAVLILLIVIYFIVSVAID
ncbi:MAG: hypothetical protein EBR30_15540 [Cytophagia bacterium]|nr:hypothetical protein [Cytophagia bacterium]